MDNENIRCHEALIAELQAQGIKKFTMSSHTHTGASKNDGTNTPESLAAKIEEMGGRGCAITDHGVVAAIEDCRPAFANHGLKLIPGIELYIDGGILGRQHLILLAVNDHGWHGICKIVTESFRTMKGDFPVISKDRLFELAAGYKGDIICTSACMQGVLCTIFLQNEKIEKQEEKLLNKQEKYTNPESEEAKAAKQELEDAQKALDLAIIERDDIKRTAEMKFSKREREIAKLEKAGDTSVPELRKELEADKAAAIAAAARLDDVKKAATNAKKRVSAAAANVRVMDDSIAKWSELQNQINGLEAQKKTDAQLHDIAKETAEEYRSVFGANSFFVEVQYHGIPEEAVCYPKAAQLAEEMHIPLIASNDIHILTGSAEDRLRRQTLRSMRFGTWEEEHAGDSELYLKDNYQLAEWLLKILPMEQVVKAIKNIDYVFNKCNVEFKTGKHYPKFSQTEDANKILEEEIRKGIALRFPEGMDEEHQARLDHELPVIESMGYADYHLIVKDFLEYGRLLGYVPEEKIDEAPLTIGDLKAFIKENGWKNPGMRIGPGRGSAVGSLVCYLLGITNLDPLKYGLLFERFLNPERVSMPDIDSDISARTRQKLIDYCAAKYGKMAVCGIMTTNAQAPKGALRIAAKYYGLRKDGIPLTALGDAIARDVPKEVNTSFVTTVNAESGAIDESSHTTLYNFLLKKYADNEAAVEIIKWAKIMEGSFTAYGAHAAGVVISDNDDVSDYLPLMWNKKLNMFTTQCDMVQVEENGLLKFDFLGLKTLDIITEAMQMIEKDYGIIIDPLKIDLEDKRVYKEILAFGRTNSVFQFESAGMKNMLKRFKPDCFEDLIILVSMFRPGPLQYLDGVIDVKNGRKEMTFLCPELKPILGKTYGAIVYQEQVMEICQKLAGFTLGHADQVRRYMSKKKAEKLAHEREGFVEGCGKNGISAEVANTLFSQMMDFASYAFNKSHAAAYSYNAYLTAWLKLYYPREFFAAALNWTDNKKLPGLMYEARKCGVQVLAPDVNHSGKDFTVSDGKVLFGLSMVAGVAGHADDILEARKDGAFTSLQDFMVRVKPNKTVEENLISAGAFDSFGTNRKAMKELAEEFKPSITKTAAKRQVVESCKVLLPVIETLETADAVAEYQKSHGVVPAIKEVTTAEKLQKKMESAESALAALQKEADRIHIQELPEDKGARLEEERRLLGNYVTGHPMDVYPKTEDVGAVATADIADGDTAIYGVVTSLQIKARKRDGAKMAFFQIEDKAGSVDVCMFTRAYAAYGNLVKEGQVLKLSGEARSEETDDGEEELKFYASTAEVISQAKTSFVMNVNSLAVFHVTAEDTFREEYEDEGGHPFLVYDRAMDEYREMKYKISEKAMADGYVKEAAV